MAHLFFLTFSFCRAQAVTQVEQFWGDVLDFCQTTCDRIGLQLLKDFGQVSADEKSDGSLVTRADEWADGEICRAIAATFPEHGILSEESSTGADGHTFPATDWCWIIDPIDGTTDFTRGIPIWGISLGLLYQGTPVFGYVFIPPLQQAFYGYWYADSPLPTAQQGPTGAYCNGNPIQIDTADLTPSHLFSFCTRSIANLQRDEIRSQKFPCKIRMLGASTYNILTIAMGATLGGVEATPKIWDIAAVWAIAQAAGATWIPLTQGKIFPLIPKNNYRTLSYPTLVVANPALASVFRPFVEGIAG